MTAPGNTIIWPHSTTRCVTSTRPCGLIALIYHRVQKEDPYDLRNLLNLHHIIVKLREKSLLLKESHRSGLHHSISISLVSRAVIIKI